MAIAKALPGFNDLGRSVTPTFLFRNRFYLQLSPHCSKMNKKSMWEVQKISRFLSTGHMKFLAIESLQISLKFNISAAREQQAVGLGPLM